VSDVRTPAAERELIEALLAPDAERRRAALETLAADAEALGETLALAVVECLGAAPKALQRRAADVLRATDGAARPAVLARLRAAMRAPDARLRWGATFALGQLGILDVEMVPSLLEALASADGDQRWAAAGLMVGCARLASATVVPALLAALEEPSAELRKMALYVLRDLAPGTPEVRDALMARLRDPEIGVRLAALSGLSRLDPLPPIACDLVLEILRDDPDPGLRRAAVSALGHVARGRDTRAVRDVLDAATRSDDPGLRRAAEVAKRRLDGGR
jgi:HEAT repeat protein